MNADFSGNTLNNVEGKSLLSHIRISDPRKDYVLDSVYLAANGTGNNREIRLRSDIADGSLKGSYDLVTLPAYFETIVKKYIPSLKADIRAQATEFLIQHAAKGSGSAAGILQTRSQST